MTTKKLLAGVVSLLALMLAGCDNGASTNSNDSTDTELTAAIAELEAAIADAELQLQKLESMEELENIEGIYGYYVDRSKHDLLTDLFAEDASLEILGRGLFIGQDRIRAYMHNLGPVGPQEGKLFSHMQFQPITHLSEDGQTANMRSRLFVMFGIAGQDAQWGEGVYENIFTREDGIWKIKKLHAYQVYYTKYNDGWANKASGIFAVFARFPPDYPPTVDYDPYPGAHVPPFHYKNPVTGG